jgi:uncharacterized membrane protein YbhN (UPF0104 family)
MSALNEPQPANRTPAAIRRWVFGSLVLGASILALLHFSDLEALARTLDQARPLWLLTALGLQATTYLCVALSWKLVLVKAGSPQSLYRLLPVAVSKLSADAIIPAAGMGGNLLLINRLVKLGVPRGSSVAALLVSMIGYYAAYASFAVVMLLLLWVDGKATPVLASLVTVFLGVAVAVPSLALWLRGRGAHPLSPFLEPVPIIRSLLKIVGEAPVTLTGDRALIMKAAALSGLVMLIDAATLQVCLLALGSSATFGTAFIALVAASIVVTLGPIPMGLGSFEAGSAAMLTLLGVPLPVALAATLLLRSFTLWLPLVPGLLMMRGSRKKR